MVGPVTWQTADPDEDHARSRCPTRDTRPAISRERRSWYGMGSLTRVEKSGFGQFLHDISYIYADITVFGLPVLLYVWMTYPDTELGVTAPALAAWTVMIVVATLLRGGWIAPLRSETLGWVSTRPSLLTLRAVYYNLTLGVGVYGSVALARLTGLPAVGIGTAVVVATLGVMAFPRIADISYHWVVR